MIVNFIFSFSVYAILTIDESFIFNSNFIFNSAKLLSREAFSKCFHYSFFFFRLYRFYVHSYVCIAWILGAISLFPYASHRKNLGRRNQKRRNTKTKKETKKRNNFTRNFIERFAFSFFPFFFLSPAFSLAKHLLCT